MSSNSPLNLVCNPHSAIIGNNVKSQWGKLLNCNLNSSVNSKLNSADFHSLPFEEKIKAVDWDYLPTRVECLRLLKANVWHLDPANIESPENLWENQPWTGDLYNITLKRTIIENKLWQDNVTYYFAKDSYSNVGTKRLGESKFCELYNKNYQRITEATQKFWEELFNTLSDLEWEDMLSRFDPSYRFELNWLLHLESLEILDSAKVKETDKTGETKQCRNITI